MKRIIAFFVSIWVFLFGKKDPKWVEVKPETLSDKLDKIEKKHFFRPSGPRVPQHNNRKNTRYRYTQYTPGGRAIFHEGRSSKPSVL